MMRRRLHTLVALLTLAATFTTMTAQQVMVNIARKQNPLPPQIAIYYENPGRFFNVSVTNTDTEMPIPVRLEVSLVGPIEGGADVWPVASDSYMNLRSYRNLPGGFIIQPKQTRYFSSVELNQHMMSYPPGSTELSGSISAAAQNMEDGRPLGLLDEGHYGIRIIAKTNYDGDVGDVIGESECFFDICYSASAPQFTAPMAQGFDFNSDFEVVSFPTDYAHFEWSTPTFNIPSLATMRQFSYDFVLYEMLANQSPEEAISSGRIAFQQKGLMTPFCNIPYNVVENLKRSATQYYVAQVKGRPVISDVNNPDYTLINNGGLSNYMVLKVSKDGGSGGIENDLAIESEEGADELPIKVTIENKFKEFTNELAPYFEEPGKMFRVSLENTSSEDLTISMLFQFFKDNWGVCPSPEMQHSTRSLLIPAGQSITLSDMQVNDLAGGYDYSNVIAFKAQTGFIIGKPAQNTFPGKDYTLSARVCKFTGKPVLREEVVGKTRVDFSVAEGIEAGNVFRVEFKTKKTPMPSQTDVLFSKPSRLFIARIENLSNISYEVLPRMLFKLKDDKVYGGCGYHERFDKAITIGPGEVITLKGDQFDDICGNFQRVSNYVADELEPKDTIKKEDFPSILSSISADEAELSFFDAATLRNLYGKDDKYASKAFLQAEHIEYATSQSVILGDIDVSISPKITDMPSNASAYFLKTFHLFDVELCNMGDKTYKVTPNLKYKLSEEDEIHTACIPNWYKQSITLKPGERIKLTEEHHELFFSSNRVITCTPGENGKYVTSDTTELYKNLDNFMDENINMDDLSFAHIDVYNQELLQTIKETDFGTVKPALIGQGDCDFSIVPYTYVHDVIIRLKPLLEPMPGNGDAYIGKTGQLWDIELANTTKEAIKAFPIIRYTFKDTEYTYAPAIKDLYKDHIKLDPNIPVQLNLEQMGRYLSGTKGVRYQPGLKVNPDTLETFDELLNLEDLNIVGVAVVDIDSINKYKGQAVPDFEARVIRGGAKLPFEADPNVTLDDVLVKITPNYEYLPENGDPYVQTPGRLFKIELTNTLDRTVKVRPSFYYQFTDTEGENYDPYNDAFDKGDSVYTLPPKSTTRVLTTSEINYVCGGNKLVHDKPGQEKPDTLYSFGNLVRLDADNKAVFMAFDEEKLTEVSADDPDFVKKVTLGTGRHTFRGTKGVTLERVAVTVKHKMNPMPGNGGYYSRVPGRLFEVTLENKTQEDLFVMPVFEYRFDDNANYYTIDHRPLVDKAIPLKGEEKRVLTLEELNTLCGGADKLCFYLNAKAGVCDTIKELDNIVSEKHPNKATLVLYSAPMLEAAYEDAKVMALFEGDDREENVKEYLEYLSLAELGKGETQFEASKDVVLGDIEIKIEPKDKMSEEAEPYFCEPGKYFTVTLKNVGIEETTFGLRLTLNNKYYGVTHPDSTVTLKPDSTLTLTEEQLNNLCGGIKAENIYQLDTLESVITRKVAKDMKLLDGGNTVQALAWNMAKGKKLNTDGSNVDTLAVGSAPFITKFRDIRVGEFILTASEIKRNESADSCYSGKGYITWNAMGFPIKIAVEFDTLYINKESVAYRGLVKSAKKEELLNFAPFELFESKIDSLGAGELGTEVKNMLAGSEFATYYTYVTETMDAIPMTFVEGSPALQLPVKLPKSVSKKSPVDIQLLSMEFRPDKASMNLIAQFTLPESNYVNTAENILVFGSPHLGMSDSTLIPKTGDLALLTDLTIKDPSTGFNITFLAPGSVDIETWNAELGNNGCFVKWENGEFADFVVDAKMAIPSSDIVKVVDGAVQDSIAPDIRLTASISDKEDWIAQVRFDAFEHVDAPGYTFTIGGSTVGVLYDHSKSKAPDGMTKDAFPKDYDWKLTGINEKHSEDEKFKEWMGFYFEELSVAFPEFIELDNSGEGKRLSIEANKIIYDESGFSMTLAATNVLDQSTASMGGWRITLDEVYLSVLQNNFGSFGFNGRFDVPLLDGQIGYDAKVLYVDKGKETINNSPDPENTQAGSGSSTDDDDDSSGEKVLKVVFETRQVDTLSLDFFVGTMDFEKDNTYFNVTYLDGDTDVELSLSGEINIAGSKSMESAVGFALPGIGFHRMRVANFVSKEVIQGNAYHFETADQSFCFDLGRWSLGGVTLGGSKGGSAQANNQQAGNNNQQAGNNNQQADNKNQQAGNQEEQNKEEDANKLDTEVEYGLNVAGFSIGLDEFSIATREQGEETHFGLYIKAKMSLIECVSATAGFTIWASFDMDTKNADYEGATFNDIGVGASIGGIVIDGTFSVKNDEEHGDGYAGTLKVALPGDLFTFNADGGYFKKVQDDPEVSNYGEKVSWGYLEIAAGGKALGAIQPVGITELSGGFYFNCNDQKKMQYGYYGLMLGVGLSFSDETVVAGKFTLQCFYDCEEDRLGRLSLRGTAHIIGGGTNKDGLLNAEMLIIYENTYQSATKTRAASGEEYFQMTASVDASADMTSVAQKLVSDYVPVEKLSMLAPDLGAAFGQDDEDLASAGAEKSNEGNKGKPKASAGAKFNFDLKITFQSPEITDGKPKWHLWLGKPQPESDRCQVTFIDFQLGDKDDAIAAWAKVWVNAYFCIGNEMPVGPNGNVLPPIPDEVQKFLDGEDVSGASQKLSSKAQQLREEQLNKMINTAKGGLMFGAAAGASIGANMLIAYFDATVMGGFDIALVKLAGATKCSNNGKTMRGINGYYATGQAYIMLKGDIGLMIDLWLFQGKISLVEAGVGALLQVGFAHPTWFYGKMRAKCSLFGGMIKFNQAIEIEAGDVCVPYYANPLADIEIFGDVYPNYDDKDDAWEDDKRISPYTVPKFVTNMAIDTEIRLLDETANAGLEAEGYNTSGTGAKNAERTYMFKLLPHKLTEYKSKSAKTGEEYQITATNTSGNRTDYTLNMSAMKPQTYYRLDLYGYALEKNKNGRWANPRFTDPDTGSDYYQEWKDTCTVYFATEALPDYLTERDIALIRPDDAKWKENQYGTYIYSNSAPSYSNEMTRPYFCLVHSRQDLFKQDTKMIIRLEYNELNSRSGVWKQIGKDVNIAETRESNGRYITWRAASDINLSEIRSNPTKYKGKQLRYTILRINTKDYNKYLEEGEKKIRAEYLTYQKAYDREGNKKSFTSRDLTSARNRSTQAAKKGDNAYVSVNLRDKESLVTETVDLSALTQSFQDDKVIDRTNDAMETAVKEFKESVKIEDFADVIYQYHMTTDKGFYDSFYSYMLNIKISGNLESSPRTSVPSTTHVMIKSIDDTSLNGSTSWSNEYCTYLMNRFLNPYTTFLYWSDFAFAPGIEMRNYQYNRVVNKVSSSESAHIEFYNPMIKYWHDRPNFHGQLLYSVVTVNTETNTHTGDWNLYDWNYYKNTIKGDKRQGVLVFKSGYSPSSMYTFMNRYKQLRPQKLLGDATRYAISGDMNVWSQVKDYSLRMIEADAVAVENFTYGIRRYATSFSTSAVKNDRKVKDGSARDWSKAYHDVVVRSVASTGSASASYGDVDIVWRPYQIPYIWGMRYDHIYEVFPQVRKTESAYITNGMENKNTIKFDSRKYLQDKISSVSYIFLRPDKYDTRNNVSERYMATGRYGTATYIYTKSKPFKSGYTFNYKLPYW